VESTIRAVFKGRDEQLIEDVINSLRSPFVATGNNAIVWTLVQAIKPNPSMSSTLGGKKLKHRHKVLRGPPWSIVCFGDGGENGTIRRNVIYDGNGDAVAQVDFGHGFNVGIHCHALVKGNLEHTAGDTEDHMFELPTVPWCWTCIPDVRQHTVDNRDVSEEDSEVVDRKGTSLFRLPETVDASCWVNINIPYEDYMGDQQYSEEW